MARPRRHVVIDDDLFFKHINFAYDESKHATRILEYLGDHSALKVYSGHYTILKDNTLFSTDSILNQFVFYKNKLYKVVSEAIFDKNSILFKDWWVMRADIACLYDKTTHRLFYQPISAYCKMLQMHALSYISSNNYACLSQVWVQGPSDKVSDCSMSFCTHVSDTDGYFCNFDLGEITKQEDIANNPAASRYLSHSFVVKPAEGHNIEYSITQDGYQTITNATADKDLRDNAIYLEITAFTERDGYDVVCENAEGYLDFNAYGCILLSTRVYMKEGKATLAVMPTKAEAFAIGVNSSFPDTAFFYLKFNN